MDWIEKMIDAVTYIESHLMSDIKPETIAQNADMSLYHFQRMFAVMTGVSLSLYIRRRRMTLAVADLKAGEKILDVALKYQYLSPTAFNRAFQSVHLVAPSLVKHGGVTLKSYQRLHFQMVVTGVESLDYRIEDKTAFRVVGASIELFGDMADMEAPISQLWSILESSGKMDRIKSLAKGEPLFEVMIPDEKTEAWQYLLGVVTEADTPEDLESYMVGAYTWATFKDSGANLKDMQKDGGIAYRAIKEWLPTSGYEYANGPDIQVWLKDDETGVEYDFWLPVRKVGTH